MKHTPTPWVFKIPGPASLEVLGKDGASVALVSRGRHREREEHVANAAFIVRACNAHEALLEAASEANRIEPLRNELSECYARINGASRTTTAESTLLSKQRVQEIHGELRAIRINLRKAIALGEGKKETP